jgi:hypothetical protein
MTCEQRTSATIKQLDLMASSDANIWGLGRIGGQRDEQRRREYEDSSSNKQDEKAGSTAREYTEK